MIIMLITFIVIFSITLIYLKGVDDMMTNHPDYDGKDLFDEE